MDCLIDAKNEKDESVILSEKRITYYKNRVKRILREGLHLHPKRVKTDRTRGRPKQTKQHNFLSRLNKKVDDVLRFIIDAAVSFDNNQGLCSGFHYPQDSGKSFVERANFGFAA